MTDPTAETPAASWPRPLAAGDAPAWVYFVAYAFTSPHGWGAGSQFIICSGPADRAAVAKFPETIVKYAAPGTRDVTVTFFTLVSEPANYANRYGAAFDRLADRWAALEDEHDQVHPDRGECGGVGSCPMMRQAHDLREQMRAELENWRVQR